MLLRKLHVNSAQKLVSASLLQNNYFGIICKSHLTLYFLSKVSGAQLFAKKGCHRRCCSVNCAENFRSAAFYNITGRISLNATKSNTTTNKARKLQKIGHIIPTSQVKLIKYRSNHQRCSMKKVLIKIFLNIYRKTPVPQSLIEETMAEVLCRESFEIFKNRFFQATFGRMLLQIAKLQCWILQSEQTNANF